MSIQHNRYFEGQVQSLGFERNGLRATVGVIQPGTYRFQTASAERMSVISGLLRVRPEGEEAWLTFPAGTAFEVGANSAFEVEATGGAAAYLCEFLG